MAQKLPRLKPAEVLHILQHHGFVNVSSKGSHMKWRNLVTGYQVIVPFHAGKELPLGTLQSIIEGSRIPEEDFHN